MKTVKPGDLLFINDFNDEALWDIDPNDITGYMDVKPIKKFPPNTAFLYIGLKQSVINSNEFYAEILVYNKVWTMLRSGVKGNCT